MATLSQMMNPQMLQMMQRATQGGSGGPSPFRSQMPADMAAKLQRNHQFQMDPNAAAGFAPASAGMQQAMRGMMQNAAPAGGGMQRGNPQGWAAGMQQMAQRFGQPATTPVFDPRAYMAQQQQQQQQRWQQMMQQLAANPPAPGMTPQSWTTPRTWGNVNAGVAGTAAAAGPAAGAPNLPQFDPNGFLNGMA